MQLIIYSHCQSNHKRTPFNIKDIFIWPSCLKCSVIDSHVNVNTRSDIVLVNGSLVQLILAIGQSYVDQNNSIDTEIRPGFHIFIFNY